MAFTGAGSSKFSARNRPAKPRSWNVIAHAQKSGGLAAFIDVEHDRPAGWKKLGVNLDDLLGSFSRIGEEALPICETLIRSNALDVVAVHSVAALSPKGRTGRRNWRYHCRRASPSHEPGAAQTHFLDLEGEDHLYFHQPDSRKNRRQSESGTTPGARRPNSTSAFVSIFAASAQSRRPMASLPVTAPGLRL